MLVKVQKRQKKNVRKSQKDTKRYYKTEKKRLKKKVIKISKKLFLTGTLSEKVKKYIKWYYIVEKKNEIKL